MEGGHGWQAEGQEERDVDVGELHGRLAPGEVSLGALAHELRFGLECDDLPELESAERAGEEAHGPVEVLLGIVAGDIRERHAPQDAELGLRGRGTAYAREADRKQDEHQHDVAAHTQFSL